MTEGRALLLRVRGRKHADIDLGGMGLREGRQNSREGWRNSEARTSCSTEPRKKAMQVLMRVLWLQKRHPSREVPAGALRPRSLPQKVVRGGEPSIVSHHH